MSKSKKPKKNQLDPLLNLKYIAYCRSRTPPGESFNLDDLVTFAKFFLCKTFNKLWKDPIWEEYTDEEILIEYLSHVMDRNDEARAEFEAAINAGTQIYGEEIYEWLDRMVKNNQEEMKKKAEELPEKVSFSPETGKDVEE